MTSTIMILSVEYHVQSRIQYFYFWKRSSIQWKETAAEDKRKDEKSKKEK